MAGRRAEADRNDVRVLDAARDVLTTQGPDVPVAAIAARAGVGIGTLYRRYATKEGLLQHLCVLAMEQVVAAAAAALEVDDAWEAVAAFVTECVEARTGALGSLAGTIDVTPEMAETSRRAQDGSRALVARAHDAGALRPGVTALDVSFMIELFSRRAPNMAADEERNARSRLLAIALEGLRAGPERPLPGRPPSPERYRARWDRPSPADASPA